MEIIAYCKDFMIINLPHNFVTIAARSVTFHQKELRGHFFEFTP